MTRTTEVERTINIELFHRYFKKNEPLGKEKLALKTLISVSSLEKYLCRDRIPHAANRVRLAEAMGVPEGDLFPEKSKRARAS